MNVEESLSFVAEGDWDDGVDFVLDLVIGDRSVVVSETKHQPTFVAYDFSYHLYTTHQLLSKLNILIKIKVIFLSILNIQTTF